MGVNHFTSDSIVIVKAEEVDMDFHARFSAKSKTYKYILCNKYYMEPWYNDYKGHRKYYLDFDLLLKCRDMLIGKHDFTSFVNDLKKTLIRLELLMKLQSKKLMMILYSHLKRKVF